MLAKTVISSPVLLVGATAVGVGVTYYATRKPPVSFDSPAEKKGLSSTTAIDQTPSRKAFTSFLWSTQLKVAKVEQVNHDTKKITFALPEGSDISGVPFSAPILTQHTPASGWLPVFRPYTPISDPDEPGVLQLLVKKYPNGKASGHLHSLGVGSVLTARGPLPGYAYKPSTTVRNVLLIAGGAGITPLYSLTKGILNDTTDKTKIQLVWGVNGTRDVVLGKELESLEKQYPERLQITYAVSGEEAKPEAPSLGDEQKWKKGHVTMSVLADTVRRFKNEPWGDEKGTKVFLCGPPAMEEAFVGKRGSGSGILAELSVGKKEVHRF